MFLFLREILYSKDNIFIIPWRKIKILISIFLQHPIL